MNRTYWKSVCYDDSQPISDKLCVTLGVFLKVVYLLNVKSMYMKIMIRCARLPQWPNPTMFQTPGDYNATTTASTKVSTKPFPRSLVRGWSLYNTPATKWAVAPG